MPSIFDKLDPVLTRYNEIEEAMGRPEVATDFEQVQTLARERASLETLVDIAHRYRKLADEQGDLNALLQEGGDAELTKMAKDELDETEKQVEQLAEELKIALLPKDPNDDRDVIVEIRSGAGGNEASLFASDLYRAYTRYAQLHHWQVDVMDSNPSDLGGLNKIVFGIQGKGAFSRLKYERGVHRVQRVPDTEAQGRIHTSTATVAVLARADEVDIKISPDDLRIDIFHAGGHGGQNVNKVATAVRIVYEPTGLTVICQDERSQYKNKTKAMAMLRAKLYDAEQEKIAAERSETRRSQVGNADRSEKIRTYNYPQDRITDHRVGASFHGIPRIMDGELDDLIDSLVTWEQEKLLAETLAG
uniref:Putative peptidyl-tRNA hydrolase domain protein n=1 Tax=uncultured marine microorganism HF4000_008B14 TaxID=455512 RepID=B3T127_9ZZZZ|nr:putative peptidyl-tRNA hydrolase domain protein [uncultured marine microorganism HF4000_008B14]